MKGMFRFIESYVHQGRIGVLVEFSLLMDFSTRTPQFIELAKDIAMHIAASAPTNIAELMKQPFVKDNSIEVSQRISRAAQELAEEIDIVRFVRWDDQPPERPATPPKSPAKAMRAANE